MDNIEDDASYPPNPHDLVQDYESSQQNNIADVDNNGEEDYDTEDTEYDDNTLVDEIRSNGQMKGIIIGGDLEDDNDIPNGYNTRMIQDVDFEREEQKKRKLKTLLSNYEFAPRKPSHGGRNSLTDWTEHESFTLLEAWGERFLKHNRKSVRSEEWNEVSRKVSEGSRIKRTETQCRNRLDTLKKQYKKEKAKLAENLGYVSKWVYFNKMDMYLSPSSVQENGHANNSVHHSGSDEMKGSFVKEESDDVDDVPPKRVKTGGSVKGGEGDAFKLLANSIDKFGDMYEKVESSKSKQLVELENMRMSFQREMEMEMRKVLEQAQVEIAKIYGRDNDLSPGNVSG